MKRKGNLLHVKTLSHTNANLFFHMFRVNHHWKAAGQNNDPEFNITEFGWKIISNVPTPEIASGLPTPPEPMKIIS